MELSGLRSIPVSEIRLYTGNLNAVSQKKVSAILTMSVDRLLAGFRDNAGLSTYGAEPYDPKAEPLKTVCEGGLLKANAAGAIVTMAYAYSCGSTSIDDSEKILDLLRETAEGLKECQDVYGTGLIYATKCAGTNPEAFFDMCEKGGMEDKQPWREIGDILVASAVLSTLNERCDEDLPSIDYIRSAMGAVASRLADWVFYRTTAWSKETEGRILKENFGAMPAALYMISSCTGREEHRMAARVFENPSLYKKLYDDEQFGVLTEYRPDYLINQFIGSLAHFIATNENCYLQYAGFFFENAVSGTYKRIFDVKDTDGENHNIALLVRLGVKLFEYTGNASYSEAAENLIYENSLNDVLLSFGSGMFYKKSDIFVINGYYEAEITDEEIEVEIKKCGQDRYKLLFGRVYPGTIAIRLPQKMTDDAVITIDGDEYGYAVIGAGHKTGGFALLAGPFDGDTELVIKLPGYEDSLIKQSVRAAGNIVSEKNAEPESTKTETIRIESTKPETVKLESAKPEADRLEKTMSETAENTEPERIRLGGVAQESPVFESPVAENSAFEVTCVSGAVSGVGRGFTEGLEGLEALKTENGIAGGLKEDSAAKTITAGTAKGFMEGLEGLEESADEAVSEAETVQKTSTYDEPENYGEYTCNEADTLADMTGLGESRTYIPKVGTVGPLHNGNDVVNPYLLPQPKFVYDSERAAQGNEKSAENAEGGEKESAFDSVASEEVEKNTAFGGAASETEDKTDIAADANEDIVCACLDEGASISEEYVGLVPKSEYEAYKRLRSSDGKVAYSRQKNRLILSLEEDFDKEEATLSIKPKDEYRLEVDKQTFATGSIGLSTGNGKYTGHTLRIYKGEDYREYEEYDLVVIKGGSEDENAFGQNKVNAYAQVTGSFAGELCYSLDRTGENSTRTDGSGKKAGSYNSLPLQIYGADPETGYFWGISGTGKERCFRFELEEGNYEVKVSLMAPECCFDRPGVYMLLENGKKKILGDGLDPEATGLSYRVHVKGGELTIGVMSDSGDVSVWKLDIRSLGTIAVENDYECVSEKQREGTMYIAPNFMNVQRLYDAAYVLKGEEEDTVKDSTSEADVSDVKCGIKLAIKPENVLASDEERLEAERRAAEEAARLEAERRAAEEAARLEAERRAAEEAERLEAERRAAEEAERLEAERRAAEEAERLEAERRAAEEAERLEAERRAAEEARREAERIEAERRAAEEARREAERIEAERRAAEEARREAERIEAERRAAEEARREAERIEAERRAAEEARREAERIEAERRAAERARRAAIEAQKREDERILAERAEKLKAEADAEEAVKLVITQKSIDKFTKAAKTTGKIAGTVAVIGGIISILNRKK